MYQNSSSESSAESYQNYLNLSVKCPSDMYSDSSMVSSPSISPISTCGPMSPAQFMPLLSMGGSSGIRFQAQSPKAPEYCKEQTQFLHSQFLRQQEQHQHQQQQQQLLLQQQQRQFALAVAKNKIANKSYNNNYCRLEDDEISTSLKMFALLTAYKEQSQGQMPVDAVMQDFASNGYASDEYNFRHRYQLTTAMAAHTSTPKSKMFFNNNSNGINMSAETLEKYTKVSAENRVGFAEYEAKSVNIGIGGGGFECDLSSICDGFNATLTTKPIPTSVGPATTSTASSSAASVTAPFYPNMKNLNLNNIHQGLLMQQQLNAMAAAAAAAAAAASVSATDYNATNNIINNNNNNANIPMNSIVKANNNHNMRKLHHKRQISKNEKGSAKHCVFCENNNEPAAVVKSHAVRDSFGRVLCPKLRIYICPICKASGDYAHTVKYCPKKPIITMEDAIKAESFRLAKGAYYKQQMQM